MDVSEIHSFLRLVGYYCRFIHDFSKIAKAMTQLHEKAKYSSGLRIPKIILRN
jgi:hypothetical protein